MSAVDPGVDILAQLWDVYGEEARFPIEVRMRIYGGQIYVFVPALESKDHDGLLAVIEHVEGNIQICTYIEEQEEPRSVHIWEGVADKCRKKKKSKKK